MTQREIREILDDTARERIPDELNLLPRIAAQYEKAKGSTMKLQWKIALALAAALIIFAGIVLTVPPVASAMKQMIGYIPGLGLVEQGAPLRVLAEPVMVEREGARVIVNKGSSDAQRTILLLSVDGLPAMEQRQGCPDSAPQLHLPDGAILPVHESSGVGSENGYTQRMVFDALPVNAEQVTLDIPCLLFTGPGQISENLEIPLVFAHANSGQVAPVIELPPTPETAQAPAASATASQPGKAFAKDYGIKLTLEKVAEVEDGYILMGSISWTDAQLGDYAVIATNSTLVDGNGAPVPYEEIAPDSYPEPGSKQTFWAYKVHGKQHAWPLTVRTGADVTIGLRDQPSFPLDLSNPPTPGENREGNTSIEIAGHAIKVLNYTAGKDPEGNGVLNFFMQSDPAVIGAGLFDAEHPVQGGGGGGWRRRVAGAVPGRLHL